MIKVRLFDIIFWAFVLVFLFTLWNTVRGSTDFVITSGILNATDEEDAQGYFNVGVVGTTVLVHPKGVPRDVLRAHKGKVVELIIREIP